MKKIPIIYALILLSLFACRKDVEEVISTTTKEDPPVTTILEYEPEIIPVVATIFGQVVNENGNPISNALVRLENNNTTTDGSGRFIFKDITVNKAGTFLTVSQTGYFEGSHRFFPQEGSVNYCKIVLLAKTPIGNFVSNNGGTVSSQEGIQLDFPPNSIVDANGNTYTGEVTVFARWLDPTADNMHEAMPGDLQGIDADAELVAIASYGMMAVELESPAGAALNLGNNQKAKLTFPIPDELLNNAPASIPLWSFYNPLGLWVEETEATKTNEKYVGEVSHFSWWNCDYPFPMIELSGTLYNENDSVFQYAYVCLEMVSNGQLACNYVNENGFFSGQVPANEAFIMTVYSWVFCGEPWYTSNIGPFAVDTDLGIINIPDPNNELVEISGSVTDCASNPVINGWVEIEVDEQSFSTYVSNGSYSLSFYNCNNATTFTILATNMDDLEQSDVFTYDISSPLALPEISACGNQLDEYITTTIDGVTIYFQVEYPGFGQDSVFTYGIIPGTDFNIQFTTEGVNATGTYSGDNLTSTYIFISDGSGGFLTYNCSSDCNFDNLSIIAYGSNQGDYVEGSFFGTVDFLTIPNQFIVTKQVQVAFRVQRD